MHATASEIESEPATGMRAVHASNIFSFLRRSLSSCVHGSGLAMLLLGACERDDATPPAPPNDSVVDASIPRRDAAAQSYDAGPPARAFEPAKAPDPIPAHNESTRMDATMAFDPDLDSG